MSEFEPPTSGHTSPSGQTPSGRSDSGRSDSGRSDSGRSDSGRSDSGRSDSERSASGRSASGRAPSPRRSSARSLIVGLAASCHPGPTIAVTVLSVVLALAIGLPPIRVVEVCAAVLAGQLAIGWSNDWLDARRDAEVGRLDKPVATGAVRVQTVRTAFIVVALAVIPLSFLLGVEAGVAHLVLVASGLSYNLGLKKTVLSWLPYVVSFGLLPLVVTLASDPPQRAAWWVMGAGALLGLAAHFANVLPDLDDDRATGVRGLPHRMGRVPSGLAAFGALLVASALVAFGAGGALTAVGLVGFLLELVIVGIGVWLVLTRPPGRLLFQLIIASALIAVVQLALSGSTLIA